MPAATDIRSSSWALLHPRMMALLVTLLAGLVPREAASQRVPLDSVRRGDSTVVHRVRLNDGSVIIGRIASVASDSVRVRTSAGELVFARAAVTEVEQYAATSMRNGELWPENPHTTRLLFSPTATPLRKGEGYLANFWIFLASGAVGITDRFTLGAGMTLIPGAGTDNLFFALPKYTILDGPRGSFAVGGLLGYFGAIDDEHASLGILYGVGTVGSRENNATLGLGWGYAGGEIASEPLVTVGVLSRMSRRLAFVSENWVIPAGDDRGVLLSAALRFLGDRLSADFGFGVVNGGGDTSPPFPLLGFAYKF